MLWDIIKANERIQQRLDEALLAGGRGRGVKLKNQDKFGNVVASKRDVSGSVAGEQQLKLSRAESLSPTQPG